MERQRLAIARLPAWTWSLRRQPDNPMNTHSKHTRRGLSRLLMLTALAISAAFTSAAKAEDYTIVDVVNNIRERVSGSSRETYWDLKQYYLYQSGRAQLFQTLSNYGYAWNGGTYGSSQNRTDYANKRTFLTWANGAYTTRYTGRSWLNYTSAKADTSGTIYYKVSVAGGGVASGMISKETVRTITNAIVKQWNPATGKWKSLDEFNWDSLKSLNGDPIRALYRSLGNEVTKNFGAEAGAYITELGEEMALLQEAQAGRVVNGAGKLRDEAEFARERASKIGGIYLKLFDAAVASGLKSQFDGFSRDYENTLRKAEGNWTTRTPAWVARTAKGEPVFNDLIGANNGGVTINDSNFPWVWVYNWSNWLYFEPDTNANDQQFWDNRTQRWYFMRATYSGSTRTGTLFWIWNSSTRQWVSTSNPIK